MSLLKYFVALLVVLGLFACSNPMKEELYRSGKAGAAQGRIGASQAGSDSIFNDMQ